VREAEQFQRAYPITLSNHMRMQWVCSGSLLTLPIERTGVQRVHPLLPVEPESGEIRRIHRECFSARCSEFST